MFIGQVYWKWIYLLNYKCFIIAVCMVLCGNICFSGFCSNDLHIQGVEREKGRQMFWQNSQCLPLIVSLRDLETSILQKK